VSLNQFWFSSKVKSLISLDIIKNFIKILLLLGFHVKNVIQVINLCS
jgi:hypothetical protein